jgi:predicted transcriptional regulator
LLLRVEELAGIYFKGGISWIYNHGTARNTRNKYIYIYKEAGNLTVSIKGKTLGSTG